MVGSVLPLEPPVGLGFAAFWTKKSRRRETSSVENVLCGIGSTSLVRSITSGLLPSGSQYAIGFWLTYWYGCSAQNSSWNLPSGALTGGSGVSHCAVSLGSQRAP